MNLTCENHNLNFERDWLGIAPVNGLPFQRRDLALEKLEYIDVPPSSLPAYGFLLLISLPCILILVHKQDNETRLNPRAIVLAAMAGRTGVVKAIIDSGSRWQYYAKGVRF